MSALFYKFTLDKGSLMRYVGNHSLQKFLCSFLLFCMSGEDGGQLVYRVKQAVPAAGLLALYTRRGISINRGRPGCFENCLSNKQRHSMPPRWTV